MQLHAALGTDVLACTTGDRHHGITGVIKRTLDRDLSVLEPQGPEALPALAGDHADAVTLIGTQLRLVGRVIYGVGKRQQITDGITFDAEIERGIRVRVIAGK